MARIGKTEEAAIYRHRRGWGEEIWVENLNDYCGKVLLLDSGKRSSLHFHMNKLETMLLWEGDVSLRLIDSADGSEYFVELFPGDKILIPRGQVHQIIANKMSILFEFSTKHEESDSHRVQKGD
jgi:oxalate decarboxylase/phosphoglucose isomerase-like protein (cupin superfamily)